MQLALQPSLPEYRFDTLRENDVGFISLLNAYRPTGGLIRGDMVAEHYVQRDREELVRFARRIACREVLSFRWSDSIWMPAFQLVGSTLESSKEVSGVLSELPAAWDDWEIARWFVASNSWLGGAQPVTRILCQPAEVREAARADRFAFAG